jgi:hypothetical protein
MSATTANSANGVLIRGAATVLDRENTAGRRRIKPDPQYKKSNPTEREDEDG